MYTILKSSGGISLAPLESRMLSARKLFIEGEITASSACAFVKAMMLLAQEDAEKPIDIYINSPGGEANAGLLMYDALRGCRRRSTSTVPVWPPPWPPSSWPAAGGDTGTSSATAEC